jgi:hypothetical protein
MSHKVFISFVVGVWGFIAIIVIIPLAMYGADVFVPSGAWCWINEDFETVRLWTHYIWIFLAEFGTVCLYAIMYFQLRRQIAASSILGNSQLQSLKRLRRVVGYMTIYPIVYIVLSLPLAAGRMATANGNTPSLTFFCCAGKSGLFQQFLCSVSQRACPLTYQQVPSLLALAWSTSFYTLSPAVTSSSTPNPVKTIPTTNSQAAAAATGKITLPRSQLPSPRIAPSLGAWKALISTVTVLPITLSSRALRWARWARCTKRPPSKSPASLPTLQKLPASAPAKTTSMKPHHGCGDDKPSFSLAFDDLPSN